MKVYYLLAPVVLWLSACDSDPASSAGFSLPEGNQHKGRLVYLKYECHSCHNIQGVNAAESPELETPVTLGGLTRRVKTYADLVTSVINPSHKIARLYKTDTITNEKGESKMRNYNDVMTVTELVDLVTFLQTKYQVAPVRYTQYEQFSLPILPVAPTVDTKKDGVAEPLPETE